jgi:molybdopterin-guanine dinucleotide biosynthesis protein A
VSSAPGAVDAAHVLAGVLVGGRGRRMGGTAKGLLAAPEGGTLLDRWRRVLDEAGVAVVLVGRHEDYASVPLEVVEDTPQGIGPLGGLLGLLGRTRERGFRYGLLLACDMPFVTTALVTRLVTAPPAAIVAPHRDDHWEPLCARYDAGEVLPHARRRLAAGRHALQPLLVDAGAVALSLTPREQEEMRDWDEPGDIRDFDAH